MSQNRKTTKGRRNPVHKRLRNYKLISGLDEPK